MDHFYFLLIYWAVFPSNECLYILNKGFYLFFFFLHVEEDNMGDEAGLGS